MPANILFFRPWFIAMIVASGSFDASATSIEELIIKNKVSAKFTAKGGHSGNCMLAELQNLTSDTQHVQIEAGRRLKADTVSDQDIFIVKEVWVVLQPGQKTKREVFGFCCESHDHSPSKGHTFTVGKMAPEPWVKLAKYINQHADRLDMYAMQSAVWVISDKHSLSGIYSNDPVTDDLTRFVASLTGQTIPWYKTRYQQIPGRVHSGVAEMISGEITFHTRDASMISVYVINSRGMTMSVLAEEIGYMPGTHSYDLNVITRGYPKGKYKIVVLEDGTNRLAEKEFEI